MSDRPQAERHLQRVHGRTLSEAMRSVRRRFGDQARILETRTITRPTPDGPGPRELVEVVVLEPEAPAITPREMPPRRRPPLPKVLQRLAADVARLEELAATLQREANAQRRAAAERSDTVAQATPAGREDPATSLPVHPLARLLLARGASPGAVQRLSSLLAAERPEGAGDPDLARAHLAGLLRTAGGDWRHVDGVHIWVGPQGAGRTTLVLGAAAAMSRHDRRVLVVQLAPRDDAEVHRLRSAAAAAGYDAAVLRDVSQLRKALARAVGYDVVLVDGPATNLTEPIAGLADLESLHRHLVVPVDGDPYGREQAWETARHWQCDWLSLTRIDIAPRPGQLLDLLLAAPLPVAMVHDPGRIAGGVALATPELLLARMLGDEPVVTAVRREENRP